MTELLKSYNQDVLNPVWSGKKQGGDVTHAGPELGLQALWGL